MNDPTTRTVTRRATGIEITILEVLCYLIDEHGLDKDRLASGLERTATELAVPARDRPQFDPELLLPMQRLAVFLRGGMDLDAPAPAPTHEVA